MFLLIPTFGDLCHVPLLSFTFHNVSINTPAAVDQYNNVSSFTFHNVSINTIFCLEERNQGKIFTFHNVSINTGGLGGTVGNVD